MLNNRQITISEVKDDMLELNKLYCMDCMDGMAQFPDKYFELAIVDPPYGIERFKHGGSVVKTSTVMKRVSGTTKKPSKEYFDELFRVSKNQIIWGA